VSLEDSANLRCYSVSSAAYVENDDGGVMRVTVGNISQRGRGKWHGDMNNGGQAFVLSSQYMSTVYICYLFMWLL